MSRDSIHVFGVRHLSPAGAWHLRKLLDEVRPDAVLIEGLTDAGGLIRDIVRQDTHPPIAILAYTDSLPVRTLVYPLARYCPEYQALKWADEQDVRVEFIDLPSDVFLAIQDAAANSLHTPAVEEEKLPTAQADGEQSEEESGDGSRRVLGPEKQVSLYTRFARLAGEDNYEAYWERHFEHNLSQDSYRLASLEFGRGIRELEEDQPRWRAENLVREAFMRRRIQETIDSGIRPEKIVVVVGAYHAPVLGNSHPAMTDDELACLKRRSSKLTLMPYSYFRLSSQSGYGAGNHAPAYFELLWEAMASRGMPSLPARYLSLVARHQRVQGTHRSTAEVIEGVRLANTLSALKGGLAPTLQDLQDAAITLIGHGERASIQDSLARVEVGTQIGSLPKGVSKTSIQDDFDRQLNQLKLEKYRTAVKQDLSLDLRENRQAKTVEAAYLDLNRSSFFHRLRVLEIPFVVPTVTRQQGATWAENWHIQWTPEAEISLVEAVLLGETVELAVAYRFKSKLEQTTNVGEAAEMVRDACQCGLWDSMDLARQRLQSLAADCSEFVAIAHAANQLGMIVRYGSVRRFDAASLLPLIDELFVQGALALYPAAICDNQAAKAALVAIDELNRVALEYHDRVAESLWVQQLHQLAASDDRNSKLSGYACAILLERGVMSNDELVREVSRRLSPGIEADLGAGWFEGLALRNRYALLARQPLWEQLAEYVRSLEDVEFRRALVFLRRAFGTFSPQEKNHIAENLAEHWGVHADTTSELLAQEMTTEEKKAVEELNEFNFDDL
ncbi:MAG: DUF5682 family protein [Pirellulales bacterium]